MTDERRYNIRDASGALVAIHVRKDGPTGKRLGWELPDGSKSLAGRPVSSLPLYGSEEVGWWPAEEPIYVTEGEKDMEALSQIGMYVLGTVTGAASTPGLEPLAAIAVGRTFCLWPDHDDIGRKHMRRLSANLYAAAARVVYGIDTTSLQWPSGAGAADFVPPIPSPTPLGSVAKHQARVKELTAKYIKLIPRTPPELSLKVAQVVQNGSPDQLPGHLDAETLRSQLGGKRQASGEYKARCPAHEDKIASLSFRDSEDGRLLIRCHAGCSFEDVMGALA